MAEEALRRAKAAGSLPAEGGLRAAEERIEKIRKESKAAKARRVALSKREISAAVKAVAGRASQVRGGGVEIVPRCITRAMQAEGGLRDQRCCRRCLLLLLLWEVGHAIGQTADSRSRSLRGEQR